jgi:5S rRNA maturation endonuclease (ribonuclease M5)
MRREWGNIDILSVSTVNNMTGAVLLGNSYEAEIKANIGNLDPEDLGFELLLTDTDDKGQHTIKDKFQYELKECNNGIAVYHCKVVPKKSGAYHIAARMFAQNKLLVHRQEFELVKWL